RQPFVHETTSTGGGPHPMTVPSKQVNADANVDDGSTSQPAIRALGDAGRENVSLGAGAHSWEAARSGGTSISTPSAAHPFGPPATLPQGPRHEATPPPSCDRPAPPPGPANECPREAPIRPPPQRAGPPGQSTPDRSRPPPAPADGDARGPPIP